MLVGGLCNFKDSSVNASVLPRMTDSNHSRIKNNDDSMLSLLSTASELVRTGMREPGDNDVLCGRGDNVNRHPGNINFRKLVDKKRKIYSISQFKREKRMIAESIVSEISDLTPPGRFLSKDSVSGLWQEIGYEKAREKTSQALREKMRAAAPLRAAVEKAATPGSPRRTTIAGGHNRKPMKQRLQRPLPPHVFSPPPWNYPSYPSYNQGGHPIQPNQIAAHTTMGPQLSPHQQQRIISPHPYHSCYPYPAGLLPPPPSQVTTMLSTPPRSLNHTSSHQHDAASAQSCGLLVPPRVYTRDRCTNVPLPPMSPVSLCTSSAPVPDSKDPAGSQDDPHENQENQQERPLPIVSAAPTKSKSRMQSKDTTTPNKKLRVYLVMAYE